jgi:hypothetical protein
MEAADGGCAGTARRLAADITRTVLLCHSRRLIMEVLCLLYDHITVSCHLCSAMLARIASSAKYDQHAPIALSLLAQNCLPSRRVRSVGEAPEAKTNTALKRHGKADRKFGRLIHGRLREVPW